MTVQCGSDETSHRPRLGPLPTPPLGRVRAPSMEPAALPIKSMALPLSWRVVPWPRPPGGSALPSSSSTPVGGEAPGDLLDTPFPLPRLCAHHVPSLSLPPGRRIRYCTRNRVVQRAGAIGHQPSSMVWDRSVRQLTIGRCRIPSPLHSPFSPPRPPRTRGQRILPE